MLRTIFLLCAFCSSACIRGEDVPKTIFQASCPWMPEIDVRSDGVMAYGAGDRTEISFADRMRLWREHGYRTLFMTGVAWGHYEDYFDGRWDGVRHYDAEAQTRHDGRRIEHGPFVPYIAPTDAYARYLCERQIKRAIDEGAEAIYLEEPEYWANAGWSAAFKAAWQKEYGAPWRPPNAAPATAWRANRLKQTLYRRTIEKVLAYAKDYARQKGRTIGCYVATHSTVNYALWRCVSPEAALASVPCVDGYIAQVWSDTAIAPVLWRGVRGSHPFEVAYLEYGSVKAMVAPTGRTVWFLTDPAADGRRGWADFRNRYEATYVAQLLHGDVDHYQVLPWPNRIYTGTYKVPGKEKPERIPADYATQMQVMINALNDMPKTACHADVGLAISDTMMLQRSSLANGTSDAALSDYFGMALPLIKRGVPLASVYLENAAHTKAFADLKVLCLSYAALKPPTREANERIAEWVKAGGTLVWCGAEDDPYRAVPDWWNTAPLDYATPSQHLFASLALGREPAEGTYACGRGSVTLIRRNPSSFVSRGTHDGADYFAAVAAAYRAATGCTLPVRNFLEVCRGPYRAVGVMNDAPETTAWTRQGRFIDLLDPQLPIVTTKTVAPGHQAFLYDLDRLPAGSCARVLCGASRVTQERRENGVYAFCAQGPSGTKSVLRILLPTAPTVLTLDGQPAPPDAATWHAPSKTLSLRFTHSATPRQITIR